MCCCLPSRKKSHLRQNTLSLLRNKAQREHPKNKFQAQPRYLCAMSYPISSVLDPLVSLISISSKVFPFNFCKYCMILGPRQALSLFYISPLPSRDSVWLMYTTELSCWPHAFICTIAPQKDNSSHKGRPRGLWGNGTFQGQLILAYVANNDKSRRTNF